mmetsp:Transcript_17385/g.42842  ORF Transcript_17385/g.42842 Transcript_17385/m.42842 type:complete len:202 (-) Transcript_17385:18-623(-)
MRFSPALCVASSSMNLAVPERAIVPSEDTRSSRVMPMPVSSMVSVLPAGSPRILILSSVLLSSMVGLATARNRSLSSASLALDTSSRRNTSLLLYSEFTMRSSRRFTSAWYSNVSVPSAGAASAAAAASVAAALARTIPRAAVEGRTADWRRAAAARLAMTGVTAAAEADMTACIACVRRGARSGGALARGTSSGDGARIC